MTVSVRYHCPGCSYQSTERETCPRCKEPVLSAESPHSLGQRRLWMVATRSDGEKSFYPPESFGFGQKRK